MSGSASGGLVGVHLHSVATRWRTRRLRPAASSPEGSRTRARPQHLSRRGFLQSHCIQEFKFERGITEFCTERVEEGSQEVVVGILGGVTLDGSISLGAASWMVLHG
jgi:hypothetical protein